MSMIVAPTIIILIDINQDITIFLDLNDEEEENNVKETTYKELKLHQNSDLNIFFKNIKKKVNVIFHSKNYVSQYLKITTPPPEFVL